LDENEDTNADDLEDMINAMDDKGDIDRKNNSLVFFLDKN